MVTVLLAADTGDSGAPLWVVIVGWVLTVGVVLLGSRQLVLTRWDRLERLVRIMGQLPDGEARDLMLAAATDEVRKRLKVTPAVAQQVRSEISLQWNVEHTDSAGLTDDATVTVTRGGKDANDGVSGELLAASAFRKALRESRRADERWAVVRVALFVGTVALVSVLLPILFPR